MKIFVLLLVSLLYIARSIDSKLPLCTPDQATVGKWINTSVVINSTDSLLNFERHYMGASCKKALLFSQAWIPSSNCVLHRFTKATIHRSLQIRLAESEPPKKKQLIKTTEEPRRITWLFIGDSALRGIFCGIIHILEGSEMDGPCINGVCGGFSDEYYRGPKPPKRKAGEKPFILGAVSYHVINRLYELAYFNTQLVLHFMYVKTLNTDPKLESILLGAAKGMKKGDTIIYNSGE